MKGWLGPFQKHSCDKLRLEICLHPSKAHTTQCTLWPSHRNTTLHPCRENTYSKSADAQWRKIFKMQIKCCWLKANKSQMDMCFLCLVPQTFHPKEDTKQNQLRWQNKWQSQQSPKSNSEFQSLSFWTRWIAWHKLKNLTCHVKCREVPKTT